VRARDFRTRTETSKLPCPSLQRWVEIVDLSTLRAAASNARRHPKKQVRQIAQSIKRFGFNNPLIVDHNWNIVAGHGRFEAAKLLHLPSVPVIRLSHLSEAELRAYRLADNKLADKASWDRELLVLELRELEVLLPKIGLDVTATGFEPLELEKLTVASGQSRNPMENDLAHKRNFESVQRAQRPQAPTEAVANNRAEMVSPDACNQEIGHQSRAKVDHVPVDAIGTMNQDKLRLCTHQASAIGHRIPGVHAAEFVAALPVIYQEQKELFAWIKSNNARGTAYELVSVYRHPSARDRNPPGASRGTKSRRGAARGE
jgi:ParB/Sulfiredoxin domain